MRSSDYAERTQSHHHPGAATVSSRRVTHQLAAIGALLCLVGTLTTAIASPATAVTNGSTVASPTRSVPWVLSLYRADTDTDRASFICTATALSARQVLTAAHCVVGSGFFFVKVGADRLSGGTLIPVEAIVGDRLYRSTRTTHDVAVLRPLSPLGLRSYARLGTPGQARTINGSNPPHLTLYGWGEDQNQRITNRLGYANLESSRQAATRAYGSDFNATVMIAAAHVNRVSRTYSGGCNGDSGGPLVVRSAGIPYVVGITSFGAGCRARIPTVFTSVGAYRPWLSAARRTLPGAAIGHNRALPVNLARPIVTGAPAVGAALTCTAGTWSANTTETSVAWSVGTDSTPVVAGPTFVVPAEAAGQVVTCTGTARSNAGSRTASGSPVPIPPAPPVA